LMIVNIDGHPKEMGYLFVNYVNEQLFQMDMIWRKKMFSNQIKTFEELYECLGREKALRLENLCERLADLTEFERGECRGEILAYEEIMSILRDIIKYGDDNPV
jgi:hypothetical protein